MRLLVSVYKELENCLVVWRENPHTGIGIRIEMSLERGSVTNENILSGFRSWGHRLLDLYQVVS